MAKTLMVTGTGTPVAIDRNLTRFFICANAPLVAESVEAYTQIKNYDAGVFSNLFIVVTENAKFENATLRFRNNGGNGNLVVVIPAYTTGTFTDAVNMDSVNGVGEKINYSLLSPNEEDPVTLIKISLISIVFSAATNAAVRYAAVDFPDLSDGTTTFYSLCGKASVDDATNEVLVRFDTNAGEEIGLSYRLLFVYVSQNLGTAATVVNLRVNSGNSGVGVNLTALTTGIFEDLDHTYIAFPNDDINYDVVSVNQLAVVIETISVRGYSTDKTFYSVFSTFNQLHDTTGFIPLGGGASSLGIEAWTKTKIGMLSAISNLTLYVKSNTITS